jgi:hypothetical protein
MAQTHRTHSLSSSTGLNNKLAGVGAWGQVLERYTALMLGAATENFADTGKFRLRDVN